MKCEYCEKEIEGRFVRVEFCTFDSIYEKTWVIDICIACMECYEKGEV